MTDLTANIQGLRLKDMYPRHLGDLFDGDQIVLVGRYDCDDARKLPSNESGIGQTTLVIKGRYEGNERAFEYPVTVNTGSGTRTYQFVEKLWAIRRVGWLLDEIQLRGKSQEVIDELIRLSRDYGIMTPYTSFLADERTSLGNREKLHSSGAAAAESLGKVSDLTGQFGAKNRQALNTANSPSMTARPGGPAKQDSKAEMDRGGAPATPTANIGYAGEGEYQRGDSGGAVENIRQVGKNYVLYRRGQIWMMPNTAGLDLEKDKDKVVQIKRFSDEYFNLVRANTSDQNAVMASQKSGEQLLVKFRDQAYNITD
jgi:Ca-activated chloride channel family protein